MGFILLEGCTVIVAYCTNIVNSESKQGPWENVLAALGILIFFSGLDLVLIIIVHIHVLFME